MTLSLVSGRVLQTREKAPAAVVRWDLMRPVAPPPTAISMSKRRAAGCTASAMQAVVEPNFNPIPPHLRAALPGLLRMVANVTGLSVEAMRGEKRNAAIVASKYIACYLAKTRRGVSFPMIGRTLGRDHSSVVHGVRKVEEAIGMLGLDPSTPDEALAAELWARRKEWASARGRRAMERTA